MSVTIGHDSCLFTVIFTWNWWQVARFLRSRHADDLMLLVFTRNRQSGRHMLYCFLWNCLRQQYRKFATYEAIRKMSVMDCRVSRRGWSTKQLKPGFTVYGTVTNLQTMVTFIQDLLCAIWYLLRFSQFSVLCCVHFFVIFFCYSIANKDISVCVRERWNCRTGQWRTGYWRTGQTQSVWPIRTAHISVLRTVNIVSHNPAESCSDNIPA